MHQKIFEIKSKMKEDSIVLNLFNTDFYFLNSHRHSESGINSDNFFSHENSSEKLFHPLILFLQDSSRQLSFCSTCTLISVLSIPLTACLVSRPGLITSSNCRVESQLGATLLHHIHTFTARCLNIVSICQETGLGLLSV